MLGSLSPIPKFLRPGDEELSSETASQIQLHRLLSLLGALIVPLFGLLRTVSHPEATDPMWARLVVASVFAGLFALSYVSRRVRRGYVQWMRGGIYLLLGWFITITVLNRFAEGYAAGLLFIFAVLIVIVGIGARRLQTVTWFSGFGMVGVALGMALGPTPQTSPVILLASMATATLLEGIAIQVYLSTRKKLRKNERRLRTITENVSEGIARSVPGEGIVFANRAFAETFGYDTVEAVLQVDPPELYADPSDRERLLKATQERGFLEGAEVEFCRKDGSTFMGLVNGTAEYDEKGQLKHFDKAIADISDQKERQRRLESQNERLESFASVVSHDLRNPLSVAKARLELARKKGDLGPLEAVDRALGRMNEIIEDLLALTRGEQDLAEELSPRPLARMARASWDHVETTEAQLRVEEEPVVWANEGCLRRLLENLFRNAVEHGSEDAVVRVGRLPSGFYVEDDGPGISEEKREEIFKEGYSTDEKGTGLGLSIVKSIAEAHGWALSVTTGQQSGARFEFRGVEVEE